ncbi:MAG: hypothetical protein EOS71_00570 [Mesorhizobium sp.]|nr:hypothetical protein EOA35_00625 [Mesorhizobium sp. M8A.F.Ca.ET.023.01.1.1]RWC77772.1 MAG: hypothetical protein EOS71_00570 [Mesorhizobium sp.]
MKAIVVGLVLAATHGAVAAEADPRALAYCKKTSKAFTEIAQCLPDADVAVRVLDDFDRIFSGDAVSLKAKCIELNGDDINGASVCVINAVKDAVTLKSSLPKGASLDDPIFNAVADEKAYKQLIEAQDKAQKRYPEKRIWGGSLYQPYL